MKPKLLKWRAWISIFLQIESIGMACGGDIDGITDQSCESRTVAGSRLAQPAHHEAVGGFESGRETFALVRHLSYNHRAAAMS